MISKWLQQSVLNRMNGYVREAVFYSAQSFVLQVIGTILSFAFNVLLAQKYGPDGVGIYILCFSIINVLTVLGRFGMQNVIVRTVASNALDKDWQSIKDVYQNTMSTSILLSVVLTILLFFQADWITYNVFKKPEILAPLQLMTLSIVPVVILNLHGSFLKGLKFIPASVFIQFVGVSAFNIPLLFILGDIGIEGAITGFTIANVVIAFWGILLWHRKTPQLKMMVGHLNFRMILLASIPFLWIDLTNLFLNMFDNLILGLMVTNDEVGIYGTAKRVALLTSLILISVNTILAPMFASLFHEQKMDELENLSRAGALLNIVSAIPIFLVIFVIPEKILSIFGESFVSGTVLLWILAIGQFVNIATGSVGYLLIMSGHEKVVRNNTIFFAALNILLQIVLIPIYGTVGAAIVTSLILVGSNLTLLYWVHVKLSIWVIPFPRRLFNLMSQ